MLTLFGQVKIVKKTVAIGWGRVGLANISSTIINLIIIGSKIQTLTCGKHNQLEPDQTNLTIDVRVLESVQ